MKKQKNKKTAARLITHMHNLSLSAKIICIILVVVLLVLSASLLGIGMILSSSNRLLYQALAGSLTYSAEDISKKLSNIESMTSAIVSNSTIRKNLITIAENGSSIQISNAISALETSITDYYQTYKSNDISYIGLYAGEQVISSYETVSSSLPQQISEEILTAAGDNSGYPVWVNDYATTYGLFLGRDCRRVEQLNFHTLGTAVVCADMDRLVQSSTNSILYSGEARYILYDEKTPFYHSPSLAGENPGEIRDRIRGDYAVLSLDSGKFFAVQGEIANAGWHYVCLIPYGHIADALNFTKLLALAFLILSLFVAFFLSRLLIRSVTVDFGRLVNKMKAFARDESQIPYSGYDYHARQDEIGVLHNQFDKMAGKIQALIQENYVHEILSKEAQIKALENQINPHFLYNTLESVNWRAKAIGEKDISSMVEALGLLLRETLSSKERSFTVAHELEIVQSYLTIQQIRFGERLNYSQNISSDILYILLPHLTLQPLVENAIRYALEESMEPCSIHIEGRQETSFIYIDVINNNSQFEEDLLEKLEQGRILPHGFGIGLLNIHKRIQLTYGTDYGLRLFNPDEEHAVARIIIPGGAYAEITDR